MSALLMLGLGALLLLGGGSAPPSPPRGVVQAKGTRRRRTPPAYVRPYREGGLVWGRLLTDYQDKTLRVVAEALGVEADWLAAVMFKESGFRLDARNASSDASGLIQFIPSTAAALGTTTEAIRALDWPSQLSLVYRYYKPYIGKMRSAGDLYLVTFFPASLGKGRDYLIASSTGESDYAGSARRPFPGARAKKVYDGHAGADLNKDGRLTAGDIADLIERWVTKGRSRAA